MQQHESNCFVFFLFQFDPEGFGEIPWDDFLKVLEAPEFRVEISEQKVHIFKEKAGQRKANSITFQDFVNVVSFHFQ